MDREGSLAKAVEGILESYKRHGNINHIEATALPSQSRVAQLLGDALDLVFPGYFGESYLDELTSSYVIGERCARLFRDLTQLRLGGRNPFAVALLCPLLVMVYYFPAHNKIMHSGEGVFGFGGLLILWAVASWRRRPAAGSERVKRAPLMSPVFLSMMFSALSEPPCASAICREIESPRPEF